MSLTDIHKRAAARIAVAAIAVLCSRSGFAQCELDHLLPEDAAPSQTFGVSVAIDGDLVIAGSIPLNQQAPGAAYIFRRSGSNWNQEARLTSEDGAAHDEFGVAVDICGDYAVVGARLDDDDGQSSGSAYVFHRVGENWIEMPKLTASDASSNDQFGGAVAISCTPDGDRIVVGARNSTDFGTSSGSAYVFRREGDLWVEEAKLLASDGAAWDLFAFSVAMDDQRIAIGARGLLGAGDGLGAVYLYTRRDTTWTEETKLSASDEQPGDFFGYSVAVNGSLVGVGASSVDDDGPSSGAAYIFRLTETGWQEEQKLYSSDISQADGMGFSVAVDGNTAFVGAWFGDSDEVENSGMVYRFEYEGDSWIETARIAASDAGDGDQFGRVMHLSGDSIVVGAPFDDNAGESSGEAYVFGVMGDCNENGLLDICEIADNPELDADDNGILDECDGGTVGPDEFSAFRGFYDSGDLNSLLESDDDKLCYEPGIVLNPTEAPITLDFFGTLPSDSPLTLDVTIESSANTVGLELTISFWNFNTNSWDVVGTATQSLNADTVRTFAGNPEDHVEAGTGAVRTRYEVRQAGIVFIFPWLDCVDHVFWSTTN